jgi:hypothetical protein
MYATNTGMGAGNMKLTLACACTARMLMMVVIVMVTMTVIITLLMVVMVAMTGLPDMIELIRLNAVIIFTCANDYADVKVRIPATFFAPTLTHVRERCSSCRFKIVRLFPPHSPV